MSLSEIQADPLVYLEENAERLSAARRQRDLGDSLKNALAKCAEVEAGFRRLSSSIEIIKVLERYKHGKKHRLEKVADSLDCLGVDMDSADDPDKLDNVARDAETFRRDLVSLNAVAMEMVDDFHRNEILPLRTLRTLLDEVGSAEIVQPINSIINEAEQAIDRKTLNLPNEIASVKERLAALASQVKELAGDPEIDEFLNRYAKNAEVPLGLVTPKVMEWLKEKQIVDSFSVRAS